MEKLFIITDSIQQTISCIEKHHLSKLTEKENDCHSGTMTLLDISRIAKLRTISNNLHICKIGLDNFIMWAKDNLNGNTTSVVNLMIQILQEVSRQLVDNGRCTSFNLAISTDDYIQKISTKTLELLRLLKNVKKHLDDIIGISVNATNGWDYDDNDKQGVFDGYMLKCDNPLYKIRDYRSIAHEWPAELDLFGSDIIENLILTMQ